MTSRDVCIRKVSEDEVHAAWQLESLAYPSDEAASEDSCKYRQREAPELFWGYFEDGKLIGMINGTQTTGNKLTKETWNDHVPEGKTASVLSLCTHPEHRKKGVASALVKHLIQHVRDSLVHITGICLFAHEQLVPFYKKLGFEYLGVSKVVHGSVPWHDMLYSIQKVGLQTELIDQNLKIPLEGKEDFKLCIRKVSHEEVRAAWLIESLSFPSEMAASEESCKYRQQEAPELFWGCYEGSKLIGITHGTETSKNEVTNECLHTHDPDGTTVCLLSLCTHPEHRKKGVATALMRHLIQHVRDNLASVSRICLCCHEDLVSFYLKFGFKYVGKSKDSHGQKPLYDMVCDVQTAK